MKNKILEKGSRWLNRKTIYPLVLGPWNSVRTPYHLQKIIDTGYFRSFVKPVEPDISSVKTVLVLAPHQDDEAIGCGGLLHKLKKQAEISVLFITDGAQGNLGVSEEESVDLRKKEAIKACESCDAKPFFLGLPNKNISVNERNMLRVFQFLEKQKPDIILAPWVLDRPAKHRICSTLIFEALSKINHLKETPMWLYQVHNVSIPNVVIDITDHIGDKMTMIQAHQSQIEQVAPYDHYIKGMNQWNAQYLNKNKRGFAEIYSAFLVREWLDLYDQQIKPNENVYLKFK